jgi:hypothetical protein
MLIKFDVGVLYKKFSKHDFCENWPSDSYALYKGINELYCQYFSMDLGEIQYSYIFTYYH